MRPSACPAKLKKGLNQKTVQKSWPVFFKKNRLLLITLEVGYRARELGGRRGRGASTAIFLPSFLLLFACIIASCQRRKSSSSPLPHPRSASSQQFSRWFFFSPSRSRARFQEGQGDEKTAKGGGKEGETLATPRAFRGTRFSLATPRRGGRETIVVIVFSLPPTLLFPRQRGKTMIFLLL